MQFFRSEENLADEFKKNPSNGPFHSLTVGNVYRKYVFKNRFIAVSITWKHMGHISLRKGVNE